jgi:hypothetical protein
MSGVTVPFCHRKYEATPPPHVTSSAAADVLTRSPLTSQVHNFVCDDITDLCIKRTEFCHTTSQGASAGGRV